MSAPILGYRVDASFFQKWESIPYALRSRAIPLVAVAALYKPANVDVALSMCRDANVEAKLPAPMCWDLALYVQRLEAAAGVQESAC